MHDVPSPAAQAAPFLGRRAAKLLLGLVTGFLVVAAVYTSILTVKRQDALRDVSRYNVTWLVSQAAYEWARLEASVGAFAVPGSGVDTDEVRLRLDIVFNRDQLLASGEVGEFLRENPDLHAIQQEFHHTVLAAEPLVDRLGQPGVAQQLLTLLAPLNGKLARLAAAAYADGGRMVARDTEQLSALHWIVSGLLLALIVCSFGLIVVLGWHNRLLQRAHAEVQDLVAHLRRSGLELAYANDRTREAMEEVQLQNRILKERDVELHTQNARFDAALNNMSQALCMADADQHLIVCNVRFLELFGIPPGIARSGNRMDDVFRAIAAVGRYSPELIECLRDEQAMLTEKRRAGSFFHEGEDGRALSISHQPMADGGWVATYEDITERRRVEARINFMAHHDALTSLPNRLLFRERLEAGLRELDRSGESLAVLCLDLDHFKTVNDTLGHPAGDMLLEIVAERLRGCVRPGDLVARLGGDEFAILQFPSTQDQASALAQQIVDALSAPYELDGHRAIARVSIGIALASGTDTGPDILFKNADMALYRAKAGGRGTYRFFEADMDVELQMRRSIELDLREALGRGELEIYYQPVFNFRANRVEGFEALLRWHHRERGMIPPSQFIPIAEELGLIIPIGRWLLRQACTDAMSWPDYVKVAVNLSPVQIRNSDVVHAVTEALSRSGLEARRLELEITETTLLQDNEKVLARLHELRRLGARTVMDDFGTGYSSLSYLRSFPFDKIKIDQSFVREMDRRPDCLAIVTSVTSLAVKLGMTTTAEGVETGDQLEQLRNAGCSEAQGYFFAPPLPLSQTARWFEPAAGKVPLITA